jgi:hypothetical protein
MTDPIRAALIKAWLEAPSFLVTLPNGTRRSSLSLEETAKVIHDFLYAVKEHIDIMDSNGNWHNVRMFADAVLAAAKDQTND